MAAAARFTSHWGELPPMAETSAVSRCEPKSPGEHRGGGGAGFRHHPDDRNLVDPVAQCGCGKKGRFAGAGGHVDDRDGLIAFDRLSRCHHDGNALRIDHHDGRT